MVLNFLGNVGKTVIGNGVNSTAEHVERKVRLKSMSDEELGDHYVKVKAIGKASKQLVGINLVKPEKKAAEAEISQRIQTRSQEQGQDQ